MVSVWISQAHMPERISILSGTLIASKMDLHMNDTYIIIRWMHYGQLV